MANSGRATRVASSGLVSEYTGIGVVQRMLFPRLDRLGLHVDVGPPRDEHRNDLSKYAAVLAALLHRPEADVFLAMVPPAPMTQRSPLVTVVHDLRWIRTRSAAARSYRRIDLQHAAARSRYLITVSDRTAGDLAAVVPKQAYKIRTVSLGPGQVEAAFFEPRPEGRLLLLGAGRHKRNELAASLLVASKPHWLGEIVTVGVSPDTLEILRNPGGDLRVRTYDRVDTPALISLLRSCSWYMHLGVEEGFGLPFLEALACGCQVVAIDQPVTREVLGDAAILLTDGDRQHLAEQVRELSPVPTDTRRRRVSSSSWDSCARSFAEILTAAAL
jgi:glycosyltransferase involved in cell wall biosynthesis